MTVTGCRSDCLMKIVPWITTGTIGAPSESAISAAPGCTGPIASDGWRVPSQKTPSACPARRTRRARRSASRSDSPRRTPKAPAWRSIQVRMRLYVNSSALAM